MDTTGREVEFYAAPDRAPEFAAVPRALANAVRIIGGRCRGRKVQFPAAAGLRPTPDRVRETLFNWLGQDLTGLATLEPYAGSGALSLEALSRGARLAVCCDREPRVVTALRENATRLDLGGLEVHRAEAKAFLARETRTFDVVFLDPPFAENPWSWLLSTSRERLEPSGSIYAESPGAITPPPGMEIVRRAKAGQVVYHLLRSI